MKKLIAYSGGADSTALAISLLRDHPEVEWTLVQLDCGQTSAAAQFNVMTQLVAKYPAFKSHVIKVDLGFNPVMKLDSGIILQHGVLGTLFALVSRYGIQIGADEMYTGWENSTQEWEDAFYTTIKILSVPVLPITNFVKQGSGIQGTLDTCGVTWDDVKFSVSCSGDPDDLLNPAKIPCGKCAQCIERAAYEKSLA